MKMSRLSNLISAIGLTGLLLNPSSSFALDKSQVISSSARDYVESVGKKLSDYKLVGVHVNGNKIRGDCPEKLTINLPKGTEFIVEYKRFNSMNCRKTALVPKKK